MPLHPFSPVADAPVSFLESFQGKYEQLGVVLVAERGERDGGEAPALEPVDSGGVDGDRLLCGDVRAVLCCDEIIKIVTTATGRDDYENKFERMEVALQPAKIFKIFFLQLILSRMS